MSRPGVHECEVTQDDDAVRYHTHSSLHSSQLQTNKVQALGSLHTPCSCRFVVQRKEDVVFGK